MTLKEQRNKLLELLKRDSQDLIKKICEQIEEENRSKKCKESFNKKG